MLQEAIRRLALQGTELANAYVGTLRLKLLKVGAIILRNTRRIRFLLSSACPHQLLVPKKQWDHSQTPKISSGRLPRQ